MQRNYGFASLIKITLCCTLCLVFSTVRGQNNADAIVGEWLVEDKEATVKIYECEDSYCGKIAWLEEPRNEDGSLRTDIENPDPSLRDRPIKGLNILTGLEYSGDKLWEDGEIYDPENGKTYSCYLELQDNGKLEVRGYIGFSLVGRSQMWTKANQTN